MIGLPSALPGKLAGIALGALLVVGCVVAAYSYVDGLSERLVSAESALSAEHVAHVVAVERGDDLKRQIDDQVRRFAALEAKNDETAAQAARLTVSIAKLNLRKNAHVDPAGAAARLNAAARDLNRLLERATGNNGDGAVGTGDAAGTTAAAAPRP